MRRRVASNAKTHFHFGMYEFDTFLSLLDFEGALDEDGDDAAAEVGTDADAAGAEADAAEKLEDVAVYTFLALRDKFFDDATLRSQFSDRRYVPQAPQCALVSKRITIEFDVPPSAECSERALGVTLREAFEARLDALGAAPPEDAHAHAYANGAARAAEFARVHREIALRRLVLPEHALECDAKAAKIEALDMKRCVFVALDVEALDASALEASDVVLRCSLQSAMQALVAEHETPAGADADAAKGAGVAGGVTPATPLGDGVALALRGTRVTPGACVRPRYTATHGAVCAFANMSAERLLHGALSAADGSLLVPEALALGAFLRVNADALGLALRDVETPEDAKKTPQERAATKRFMHVSAATARRAAALLAAAHTPRLPWSDPFDLRFALAPRGAFDARDTARTVTACVRVWYILAPRENALDNFSVWTSNGLNQLLRS
jgi:hypothetical protein